MVPHAAWNATREPWVHTPEYKEYLANQLKMAQIDLLSKLQMTQVDHNLRQTCRYNKENRDNIYDSGTKQRQLSFNTNVFLLVILF
jgi:hypothetical protein